MSCTLRYFVRLVMARMGHADCRSGQPTREIYMPNIDLFFRDPSDAPQIPGEFSTLYLLRRDIETCLGRDPTTKRSLECQALWPAAMAIFAGIDLLAKFYAGNDDNGKVCERFNNFINGFFDIPENDAKVIYQLRNALIHSFGLYSKHKTEEFRFTLTYKKYETVVNKNPHDRYFIDIYMLSIKFDEAVIKYHKSCESPKELELQEKFNKMFDNYGGPIHIGEVQV